MVDEVSRAAVADQPVPRFDATAWTPLARPLAQCRLAIVTTAGLHLPGQPGWQRGDQSFRELPSGGRDVRLGHQSANFDRSGFAVDVNVAYPVDRLAEMRDDGLIGSLAPRNLSFMGAQDETLETIRLDSGPAAARLLRADGVDAVLLTPMCPLCTRTVGTIAHVLEAHGISTVMISLVRSFAERLRPPRVLHCDFPFGRALGRPADPVFQRRVLSAAFELLGRDQGPVLEVFPERIEDDGASPVSCSVPPPVVTDEGEAVAEALAYLPAYNRHRSRTGRTLVGRAVDPSEVTAAVALLARIADGHDRGPGGPAGSVTDLANDVRAYYEEAAMELADHVPAARSVDSWFFQKTITGKVLLAAQASLRDRGEPRDEWFGIAPRGYA